VLGELRSDSAATVRRLDEMETREVQADARGISVIAGGVLLTGPAAEPTIRPLLGLVGVFVCDPVPSAGALAAAGLRRPPAGNIVVVYEAVLTAPYRDRTLPFPRH
jgi:hypothetical protein